MVRLRRVAAVLAAVIVTTMPMAAGAAAPTATTVVTTYADIARAMYQDSYRAALTLASAVGNLLATPTQETLAKARAAWVAARVPYMQSEAYRFGNPIVEDWEREVNSWPLDEGLIDYVDHSSYDQSSAENPLAAANVIANPSLHLGSEVIDATVIDAALLRKLQEADGVASNVATGYHAIEFLLWGQDLNGTGPGAGKRPASDYSLTACTGGHCDRRRAYLQTVTGMLVKDLQEMAAAWDSSGRARAELLGKPPADGLAAMLSGLGVLSAGELAGERIKLGLLLHDPEEEQDCFSDNTHNSHYDNQLGMMAVWNGSYRRIDGTTVDGPSLAALTRVRAPDAAARLDQAMATTLAKIEVIKRTADSGRMAYDQMLAAGNAEGNRMLGEVEDALVAQARAIEGVMAGLDLTAKAGDANGLDAPASDRR